MGIRTSFFSPIFTVDPSEPSYGVSIVSWWPDLSYFVVIVACCMMVCCNGLCYCGPLYLKNYLQSKQVTVRDSLGSSDMIWCHRTRSSLDQVMACCLFGAKPLPEPSLTSCQLDPKEQTPRWNFNRNSSFFIKEKAFETMVCKLAVILFRPQCTGITLCMRPANGRRRYNVTSSLIGWTHTQNNPWMY